MATETQEEREMDGNDRRAIEDLFHRLSEAERRLPQRDPDAEALIGSEIARNPGAPYYMAQTIVVQQQALENAQERIADLEARGSSGGFLGGLFGDSGNRGQGTRGRQQMKRDYDDAARAPWGSRGGGGFLAGAAQTAMGVAGGVLLANMIGGALFGGSDANAQEAPPEDVGADAGGDFDAGDFGDF
jgi:uncharacterized protein